MFQKPISPSAMSGLVARRNLDVASKPLSAEADFSAGCLSPIARTFKSSEDLILWIKRRQPYKKLWRFHAGAAFLNDCFNDNVKHPPVVYFDALLPCRHCAVCLRRRARLWRYRALSELALSSRTWFATYTLNPQSRLWVDVKCRHDGDDSSPDTYLARHMQVQRWFTLYFKRLRKHAGFRYLLVSEAHKDGWPHYHAFLHERGPMLTKALLQSEWSHGFTNFKLVPTDDKQVVYYVTKYVAKQALARIRASLRYGNSDLSIVSADTVAQVWPQRDMIDPKTTCFGLDCPF